jgi:arylsulfatase A-like enzyme
MVLSQTKKVIVAMEARQMKTTRRQFVQGSMCAGLPVSSDNEAVARPTNPESPDIVFIMADDMGHADLSCYGQNGPSTKHIDSLATDGIQMNFAYANSCVCSATRTGLITGRYQYRLPLGLEEPLASFGEHIGLPVAHPTLPSLLRNLGYSTSLVGKWHLGGVPNHGPLQHGYDRFWGIYGGATDYFSHKLGLPDMPNDSIIDGAVPVHAVGYLTDLLGKKAAAEIRTLAASPKPYFLSLHFTAPHWPWEGPEDAAAAGAIADPRHQDGGNIATYHRMLKAMDDNVGRVLAAVARSPRAANTIVIFTCDNGGERFSDTWPLLGHKGELLEGGIRVPLLVRWPKQIKAGQRSDQVTMSMDWLPTLLDAARSRPHPDYPSDGISILNALRGGGTTERKLYWRFKAHDQAAMRDGKWKYLKLGAKEHLFDIEADQREQADLQNREAARFAEMREAFAAWNKSMLPYPPDSFSEDVKKIYTDRY